MSAGRALTGADTPGVNAEVPRMVANETPGTLDVHEQGQAGIRSRRPRVGRTRRGKTSPPEPRRTSETHRTGCTANPQSGWRCAPCQCEVVQIRIHPEAVAERADLWTLKDPPRLAITTRRRGHPIRSPNPSISGHCRSFPGRVWPGPGCLKFLCAKDCKLGGAVREPSVAGPPTSGCSLQRGPVQWS